MTPFLQGLRERGETVALEDAQLGARLTYADVARHIGCLHAFLHAHGVKPGDRVLQRLPNSSDALLLMLAVMTLEADCAPLSIHASVDEADQLLRLVNPRLVVQGALGADATADFLASRATSVRFPQADELPAGHGEALDFREGGLITSTSGTSDRAKLLRLSFGSLRACARAFVAANRLLQGCPRYLHTAPVWSLSGLFNLCIIPLETGATVLTGTSASAIHPGKMLHDAARFGADVLWLPPAVLRSVLADALSAPEGPHPRLRCLLTGMSAISAEEKIGAQRRLGAPVLENYGLAETLLLTSAKTTDGDGSPLPGVRLSIEKGEIHAASPFAADGYLTDGGGLAPLNTDDTGAVRTGDLGRIKPSGELVVTGRSKAIVKRDGETILLHLIEAAARQTPGVTEAVAVSEAADTLLERYTLCVTGSGGGAGLVQAVRMMLALSVDRHAWPDEIVALPSIPLLPNGKADVIALRGFLNSAKSEV